jgi:hypothetical protein
MIRILRWALVGFCLINIAALLYVRGGLGEYLRGAALTTAHLGPCVEDVDGMERSNIVCRARWDAGDGPVEGAVSHVEETGARAAPGASGSHFAVDLPGGATEVRVFARGARARPADTRSMAAGAGVLLLTVALLAWDATIFLRGRRRRRGPVVEATREPHTQPATARPRS